MRRRNMDTSIKTSFVCLQLWSGHCHTFLLLWLSSHMLPLRAQSMIQAAVLVKLAYRLSSLYPKHPASKICLLPMKLDKTLEWQTYRCLYSKNRKRYTIQEEGNIIYELFPKGKYKELRNILTEWGQNDTPQTYYRFPVSKGISHSNKSFKHDRLGVWIPGVGNHGLLLRIWEGFKCKTKMKN